MLWNTIATGKRPWRHGIHGFTEFDPQGRVRPVTSSSRRVKALWNILSEQGVRASVVSWFASHPAEAVSGVDVSEAFFRLPPDLDATWEVPAGSVQPVEEGAGLAGLRVKPGDIDPRVLDLLIPQWREVQSGKCVQGLLRHLAELYSVHNVAVTLADEQLPGFLGVYYHFLDWICHDFMEYHPPRREGITERDFALYGETVRNAYRLQDLLLGDMMQAAGADAAIIVLSDHGFLSGDNRPVRTPRITAGIAAWHRPLGMLAMAGPGVRPGQMLQGGSLLDIAPTVLSLFGLPSAQDMDGAPLVEALADVPPPPVESWESLPGSCPRPAAPQLSEEESDALLRQFVDLGYVDAPEEGDEADATRAQNLWNVGVDLLDAGRAEDALVALEEAYFLLPERPHFAQQLAEAQIRCGLLPEARQTLEVFYDAGSANALANLKLGNLLLRMGATAEAIEHLQAARHAGATGTETSFLLGSALLVCHRWSEAEAEFRTLVEEEPDNAAAWLGLATAHLRQHAVEPARAAAHRAADLRPSMPRAQMVLAMAARLSGDNAEAMRRHEAALALDPSLSHSRLALLSLLPTSLEGLEQQLELLEPLVSGDKSSGQPDTEALERLRAAGEARMEALHARRQTQRERTVPVERLLRTGSGKPSGKTFVIVSGLPRSGTSLLMQMLERGGLPPMTDRHRAADEDNPEGYYEWEPVRRLGQQPGLIEQCAGHVVKVVAPLLEHLPRNHRYKVLFATRPPAEVARSQERMLERLGRKGAYMDAQRLASSLAAHQERIRTQVERAAHFDVMEINYPSLVADPGPWVQRIADFLGGDVLPSPAAMAEAVRPALHRNREGGAQ